MNGCRLPITRKFLLRSQVQGNTNLTEEGKDTWNSSGFRLTCTDPGGFHILRIGASQSASVLYLPIINCASKLEYLS